MNKNSIRSLACMALGLLTVPGISRADLRLGVGLDYVSGFSDVADLYVDNVKAPYGVQSDGIDDVRIPVGLKFTGAYQWDSGVRTDFNVGPLMMVLISVSSSSSSYSSDDSFTYIDVPIGLTVGYTFLRNASISPYARVGVAHHIISGDFNESASPGLLAAVGVDFMRMRTAQVTVELAVDKSDVEFDKITCSASGINCRTTRQSLHTADILFGVSVKF